MLYQLSYSRSTTYGWWTFFCVQMGVHPGAVWPVQNSTLSVALEVPPLLEEVALVITSMMAAPASVVFSTHPVQRATLEIHDGENPDALRMI